MASTNEEVAALMRGYAELLGLAGGDPFRVRSYEKAAKAVAGYPDDLGVLPETALTRVPGVGSSVAAKIVEYRRTGTIGAVDDLRARVPPGALLLAHVPGVGHKRALQLARELGITSVEGLAEAIRGGGRLRSQERGTHPARHRRGGQRRRTARRLALAPGGRHRGRHLRRARRSRGDDGFPATHLSQSPAATALLGFLLVS
jgi:DNA polymerase/3'-5' exonuclease PolX